MKYHNDNGKRRVLRISRKFEVATEETKVEECVESKFIAMVLLQQFSNFLMGVYGELGRISGQKG